ncbi:ras-related protein Rab-13 [Biomphalaria pfeifferi]|uniref:Ras-related protein Rab-13 n=1 Tax=Biomphalaria pfeifferi TaxID=112525 RepID=A0AAD8FF28_BIOPF|nr:ras-related protein Rab-13 [Biomphalaria pfeifferi]
MIGDAGVGKSSLFFRVRDGRFYGDNMSTIGIDSLSKTFSVDNVNVKIILIDTAGIERFQTLTSGFYRNSHAVFLVFSVDNPVTLSNLIVWNKDVCKFAPEALRFVIGNKHDLHCGLPKQTLEQVAYTIGCECVFTTSAKTGEGILNLLDNVCQSLVSAHNLKQYQAVNSWQEQSIHVNNGNKGRQSTCCS